MLKQYNEEKNALTVALKNSTDKVSFVTADDIIQCVESLYNLTHNGQKIQELFMKQKTARKDENQSEAREYVYLSPARRQRKRKTKQNAANRNKSNTRSAYATDNDDRQRNKINTRSAYASDNDDHQKSFNDRNKFSRPPQHYGQQQPPQHYRSQHYGQQQPPQHYSQQQPPQPQFHQQSPNPLQINIHNDQFEFQYGNPNQRPKPIQNNYPFNNSPLHHPNQNNYGNQGAYPKNANPNNFNLSCRIQNNTTPTNPPSLFPNYQYQQKNQNANNQRGKPTNRSNSAHLYNKNRNRPPPSFNENKNRQQQKPPFTKDLKYRNQKSNIAMHSDSESGRDARTRTRLFRNSRGSSNFNKAHNLDGTSSESSSSDWSSDDEVYHTAHK